MCAIKVKRILPASLPQSACAGVVCQCTSVFLLLCALACGYSKAHVRGCVVRCECVSLFGYLEVGACIFVHSVNTWPISVTFALLRRIEHLPQILFLFFYSLV